jgi:hypothetical protein
MQACAACGTTFDPSTGGYDSQGRFVCPRCQTASAVEDRAVSATSDRWPALGIAALSLICNPFFITSVFAIMRAREELALAESFAIAGDVARASSLRTQAWLAIGLVCLVPLVVCSCLGLSGVMSALQPHTYR